MTAALVAACGGSSSEGADAGPSGDADIDCEPVAQSGCATGLKCGFVLDEPVSGIGHVACVADGQHDVGEYCDAPASAGDSDSCLGGLHCYAGRCRAICDADAGGAAACADGTCGSLLDIGFDVCLATCDPLAQDCPDTPGGNPQGCYVAGDGPLCAPVFGGTGTPPGGACFFVNDCARGAGCFDPGICMAYCDVQLCPPDGETFEWQPCPDYCDDGQVCRGITGDDRVGACTAP